jgi:hypothetical protein
VHVSAGKNASRFQANIQKLSVTYIAVGEMVSIFMSIFRDEREYIST